MNFSANQDKLKYIYIFTGIVGLNTKTALELLLQLMMCVNSCKLHKKTQVRLCWQTWMSSVQAVEGDNGVREHVHASNTLMSDGGRRSRAEARIRAGIFMKTLHRHQVNEWEV